MSDSVWPHRRQPTRLPSPWDSPGKNTGEGCHFLLQCMKVKVEVAQSCLILSDSMDCSLPGSSIHGIFQARVLEWVAIAFSTSGHDYRQNHHFDIWTFVCKAMSLLFYYFVWVCHNFSFKEQVSFNFMAAVSVHSDFGAQENKVCHCFSFFPIYLPWSDGTRCLIFEF